MKKKKGFTFAELLISMSLLSFIVVFSSVLFDNAIHTPNQLRKSIENNSTGYSEIESEILSARTKPDIASEQTVYNGINIRIKNIKIDTVRGRLISFDGQKVKKNADVGKNDKIITFVGSGHREIPTAVIDVINISEPNGRFTNFPINSTTDLDIVAYYKATNPKDPLNPLKTIDAFKRVRMRFLSSPVADRSNRSVFAPYVDDAVSYVDYPAVSSSEFEYFKEAVDSPDGHLSDELKMTIKKHSSDKEEYFDALDKTYGVSATTLNKNGHTGETKYSFEDKDEGKHRAVHIVGLPYNDDLLAHYDYNLVIAQSNVSSEKNRYYSLYDMNNALKTSFSGSNAIVSASANGYDFNWKKNDSTTIIGTRTGTLDEYYMKISTGFLPKVSRNIDTDVSGSQVEVPFNKKSYGNTVFYKNKDSIAQFHISSGDTRTFFVKFNLENYNEKFKGKQDISPIALFSHNWDLQQGKANSRGGGFVVFADKDGELYLNSETENRKLNFNLKKDGALYKNIKDASAFDKLNYDLNNSKRDGRENFVILGFTVGATGGKINVQVNALKNKKQEVSNEGTQMNAVVTEIVKIHEFNLLSASMSNPFHFGGVIKKAKKDTSAIEELEDPLNGDGATEVSDILLYEKDLSKIKNGSFNYLQLTMEYLYRKYLTENERKKGGYDAYFINKY